MDEHATIDVKARRALAVRLRRLASGRLATSAFDDARVDVHLDEALVAISAAGWSLYHDG